MITAKEFEGELWIRAADIHLLTKEKSREWVGLTDDEMQALWKDSGWYVTMFKAVEAKLKELNT
jgi:hypothetical protein